MKFDHYTTGAFFLALYAALGLYVAIAEGAPWWLVTTIALILGFAEWSRRKAARISRLELSKQVLEAFERSFEEGQHVARAQRRLQLALGGWIVAFAASFFLAFGLIYFADKYGWI